jgi:hypothetical protein
MWVVGWTRFSLAYIVKPGPVHPPLKKKEKVCWAASWLFD